jgi:NADPH:quinone reductase-like Zn-dependent oxidoreductase
VGRHRTRTPSFTSPAEPVRAAVRTRYGPPDVVTIAEIATPVPGDREVLVKVHLATVNRTDCGFRAGKPFIVRSFSGLTKPRARVLGGEFAGVVEATDSAVTSFAVGDRVFGFSEDRFGAHAEYLTIPEDAAIASTPPNLTDEQAAPSTEASHYALTNIRAARIRAGQDVLVYGATGAIGTAAVQLLRDLGASVTAVCATDQIELVRSLGADRVIDRTAEDFTKDDHTYDVVFDAVGKSSFRTMQASSEAARDPPFDGSRATRAEPDPGAPHPAVPRPETHVPDPAEARPRDHRRSEGVDRVRSVHTGDRPAVRPG